MRRPRIAHQKALDGAGARGCDTDNEARRSNMGRETSDTSETYGAPPVGIESFAALARSRRSTRHFRPDPVPRPLLDDLLDAARWAPSGFNLQPTHFVVVTDAEVKARLYPACMKQRQILEAGATVVFTGDRRVMENQFEQILQQDCEAGAINADYERLLRKAPTSRSC